MTTLLDAPDNIVLKIKEIIAGDTAKIKLSNLGLNIGDNVIKIRSKKSGPVLLHNESNAISKLAIGKGLAEKIGVEEV
jgi:Fe2+ transport system protein FeoA